MASPSQDIPLAQRPDDVYESWENKVYAESFISIDPKLKNISIIIRWNGYRPCRCQQTVNMEGLTWWDKEICLLIGLKEKHFDVTVLSNLKFVQ